MHDYFDILGVPRDARGGDIRRASARRAARTPPDFLEGGRVRSAGPTGAVLPAREFGAFHDVAIDFVDMGPIVDRMRAAFLDADR